MLGLLGLLLVIWLVFVLLGALVKGLLWLLVIGAVLFVGALLVTGMRMGRNRHSAPR